MCWKNDTKCRGKMRYFKQLVKSIGDIIAPRVKYQYQLWLEYFVLTTLSLKVFSLNQWILTQLGNIENLIDCHNPLGSGHFLQTALSRLIWIVHYSKPFESVRGILRKFQLKILEFSAEIFLFSISRSNFTKKLRLSRKLIR